MLRVQAEWEVSGFITWLRFNIDVVSIDLQDIPAFEIFAGIILSESNKALGGDV